MADTVDPVDPEKVAADPKTIPVMPNVKSEDGPAIVPSKADDALRMLEAGPVLGSIDPQKSKRLLRRIDLYIMPLICMWVFHRYLRPNSSLLTSYQCLFPTISRQDCYRIWKRYWLAKGYAPHWKRF